MPQPSGDIRPKKKAGFKQNYFKEDELMAVKKLARNLCEARSKLHGCSRTKAAQWAVGEIHRRLPDFVYCWEVANQKSWEDVGGDLWFAKRIDHKSTSEDNKGSHGRVEHFTLLAAQDSSVYTWEEWIQLVHGARVDVVQRFWAYLLPFSYTRQSIRYQVQKVGITTNLKYRHREHSSRGPRGEYGNTGLWPAKWYTATAELGPISKTEAAYIEKDYIAQLADGKPPVIGHEFFETDPAKALFAFGSVSLSKKFPMTSSVGVQIGETVE